MGTLKMKSDRIENPIDQFRPGISFLTEEIRKVFNDDLVAFMLYGSILTRDYIRERSDINSLIILKRYDLDKIKTMSGIIRRAPLPRLVRPLLFTKDELKASMELFPLEFLDIGETHLVLTGEDCFSKNPVPVRNLRLLCERELRSRFHEMKDFFPGPAFNIRALNEFLINSFNPLLVIIKNILRIENRTLSGTRAEILQTAAEWLELNPYPFRQILLMKQGILKPGRTLALEIFRFLFTEVQKLLAVTDQWKVRGKK
jgi:predicted nucleotidyltransferase